MDGAENTLSTNDILSADVLASTDDAYRYLLRRQISDGPRKLLMIIHCPGWDDSDQDPTTARCVELATAWGYHTLYIGARFARRCTVPDDLWAQPAPNDYVAPHILRDAAAALDALARAEWDEDGDNWAGVVICWGSMTLDNDLAINSTSLTTATLMRSLMGSGVEIDTLETNDETDGAPKSPHDVAGDTVERVPYGG